MTVLPDHVGTDREEGDDRNPVFSANALPHRVGGVERERLRRQPTSPSGSGNLVVQLTDDHTDNVEQVKVFFNGVTADAASGPSETMALVLTDNPQDLLLLRDDVIPLATAIVAPGDYVSLRINLDEDQSSIVEGGRRFPFVFQVRRSKSSAVSA